MIDIVFLAFIAFVLVLGLKRPFLWVLLYVYIDILAPQRVGFGMITTVPVSLIAFAAAFGGWLALDRKEGFCVSWRQGLLLALLVYCWWTTGNADFPEDAATKWDWVWKALLFAMFVPLTLTTRLRIEAIILAMMLTLSIIIIGPGIKVVTGGGGYGTRLLLVDDNSGLYESSVLACMSIAVIPFILWLRRYSTIFPTDWRVNLFCAGFIFSCLLMPVGTEARTGLICVAVLGLMLFRNVKKKALFAGAAALAAVVAIPFLPSSFTDRMSTIGTYEQDQSASTRLAVWMWTIDYVMENPAGGGFDAFRGNEFRYEMPVETGEGNTKSVRWMTVVDRARAYHSAYFEVLGEQGFVGAAIWMLLQVSGLWQMWQINRRWKKRAKEQPGEENEWQAPLATALGQAQIIYLVGATFTGIAYTPLMLMLLGIQMGFASYLKRVEAAADTDADVTARPSRHKPPVKPTIASEAT